MIILRILRTPSYFSRWLKNQHQPDDIWDHDHSLLSYGFRLETTKRTDFFSDNLLVLAMDINYSEDLSGLKYEDL